MKKRVLAFLLMTLICLSIVTPAMAADEYKITWVDAGSDARLEAYIPELNWATTSTGLGKTYKTYVWDLATCKRITQYDYVYPFSDGLACVEKDGKYGYIDTSGKVAIPLKYSAALSFSDGVAWVSGYDTTTILRAGGTITFDIYKSGCIDTTGKVVVPFGNYEWWEERLNNFSGDVAFIAVYEGPNMERGSCFIDKTGKRIFTFDEDTITKGFYSLYYFMKFSDGPVWVRKDGKYGLIDKTGTFLVPLGEYDYKTPLSFSEGLTWVEKDGKYGYIDTTGRVVIPLEYDSASNFSDGLARVEKDGKYGYIDTAGKVVIPFEYAYANDFSDGLANVPGGYIDTTGKVVIPLEFEYRDNFSGGRAVVRKDGKCGLIDKTGTLVVPMGRYDSISHCNMTGFDNVFEVWKGEKGGLIDANGNELAPPIYDFAMADYMSQNSNAPYIGNGSKLGILTKVSQSASGTNGAQWVKSEGHWKYQDASSRFLTGWQKVGGSWYYLNANGIMLTGWQKIDGKWYYLNSSGAMLANTVTPDGYRVGADGAMIAAG